MARRSGGRGGTAAGLLGGRGARGDRQRLNKDHVNPSSYTYDGFSLQVKNSIVDHVSTSWYSDEGISITDAGHTSTVQYATIGEGLAYAGHAFGSIIATEVDGTHYSFNHNLYAHNSSRLPAIGSELGQTGAVLNFTNNVVYNWPRTKAGYSATDQHSSSNFVGNYYITGYNSGVVVFSGGDGPASAGFTRFFQTKTDPALANKADFNKNGVLDGIVFGPSDKMPDNQSFYSGSMTFVGTPFPVTGSVTPDTADVALARVLAYAGANWQARNPIDQRIVESVGNGSGRIINDVTGGWLEVADSLTIGHGATVDVAAGRLAAKNLALAPSGTGSLTISGGLVAVSGTLSGGASGRVVLAGGTLCIGAGGTTGVLATAVAADGTLRFDRAGVVTHGLAIGGTGTLVKDGPGTLALAAANPFAGATTIRQGTLHLDRPDALSASIVSPMVGGTLAIAPGVHAALAGLDLASGGLVDVGTGGLTVASGLTPEAVTAALVAGRATGGWNGTRGIVSSAAAATPPRTIGWLDSGNGAIFFAWAAPGDANLDGAVDVLDIAQLISAGAYDSGHPATWSTGDFNYDGALDLLDIVEIMHASVFDHGTIAPDSPPRAVPEPNVGIAVATLLVGGLVCGLVLSGNGAAGLPFNDGSPAPSRRSSATAARSTGRSCSMLPPGFPD